MANKKEDKQDYLVIRNGMHRKVNGTVQKIEVGTKLKLTDVEAKARTGKVRLAILVSASGDGLDDLVESQAAQIKRLDTLVDDQATEITDLKEQIED